jgi:ParB-like chromosome segregation protein Spo0J
MKAVKVRLDELHQYANNPRRGNVKLIAESLREYGQYKPITVNKATNEILVGNHTYLAAKELGWTEIEATFIEVDAETAAKIVLIDNRATDLSEYDNNALLELLERLNDLEHTGYGDDEFDDVLARIEEQKTPSVLEGLSKTGQAEIASQIEGLADRYKAVDTKVFMVELENTLYIWTIEQLGRYRAKTGAMSNSDALVKLLEENYKEKAPQ